MVVTSVCLSSCPRQARRLVCRVDIGLLAQVPVLSTAEESNRLVCLHVRVHLSICRSIIFINYVSTFFFSFLCKNKNVLL